MPLLKFAKFYKLKYLTLFISFFVASIGIKKSLNAEELKTNYPYGIEKSSIYDNESFFDDTPLASELIIDTNEHSPLYINNTQPLKQQFHQKVSISITGEDGDLLYAKEVAKDNNLWVIDWVKMPDYERPLGGSDKSSNTYSADVKIVNDFGNAQLIKLTINVVDIDEERIKNSKKLSSITNKEKEEDKNINIRNKKKIYWPDEISLGVDDKGGYLGFIRNIGIKNQFEIGINYMDIDISGLFKNNSDVKLKNSSVGIAFRRFLKKTKQKQGFYLEAGADIAKINIYSDYLLTNQTGGYGTLSVTCSGCGKLNINSIDKYTAIPSLALGYQKRLSKRTKLNFRAGIQYINIPKFTWQAINSAGGTYYPPFLYEDISEGADEEIEILNSRVNKTSKFLPTLSLNLIYSF